MHTMYLPLGRSPRPGSQSDPGQCGSLVRMGGWMDGCLELGRKGHPLAINRPIRLMRALTHTTLSILFVHRYSIRSIGGGNDGKRATNLPETLGSECGAVISWVDQKRQQGATQCNGADWRVPRAALDLDGCWMPFPLPLALLHVRAGCKKEYISSSICSSI